MYFFKVLKRRMLIMKNMEKELKVHVREMPAFMMKSILRMKKI